MTHYSVSYFMKVKCRKNAFLCHNIQFKNVTINTVLFYRKKSEETTCYSRAQRRKQGTISYSVVITAFNIVMFNTFTKFLIFVQYQSMNVTPFLPIRDIGILKIDIIIQRFHNNLIF